jgi:hypothetical protein
VGLSGWRLEIRVECVRMVGCLLLDFLCQQDLIIVLEEHENR